MTTITHPPARPLRLGTRSSPLAMAQAHMVADAVRAAMGWAEDAIDIIPVLASGDKVLDRPLADIGGKALWTKELDRWLLDGEIDFAVHSMKDVETIRPSALAIAAMLPRADVRDRLLGARNLAEIRTGGIVGTSSPRRSAQIKRARPDLTVTLFRGNVQTRLAKLDAGEVDATLLAAAGLDRLGQGNLGHAIEVNDMLPAPAQGAIGIECRSEDAPIRDLLAAINHHDTYDCVMAERSLLLALGGTCHSPIAALAIAQGRSLWLRAEIIAPNGDEHVASEAQVARADFTACTTLGHSLLDRASDSLRGLFTS
jgi:hydroxymethylbilane synthase